MFAAFKEIHIHFCNLTEKMNNLDIFDDIQTIMEQTCYLTSSFQSFESHQASAIAMLTYICRYIF